jgi:hypothetical protein
LIRREASITQLAKSLDEWKTVVSQLEVAIALMKTVSSSSPNYVVSQQIKEHQINFNYAGKNYIGNAATALLIQCSTFLTNDQRFRSVPVSVILLSEINSPS